MTADDHSVQIAVLDERFKAMTADMVKMESQLVDVGKKLDAVLTALSEAKGGWRLMMFVGGAFGTISAGLIWVFNHVKVTP